MPVTNVLAVTQTPHSSSSNGERPAIYQALVRSGEMKTKPTSGHVSCDANRDSVGRVWRRGVGAAMAHPR